jgi:hypothetical protein
LFAAPIESSLLCPKKLNWQADFHADNNSTVNHDSELIYWAQHLFATFCLHFANKAVFCVIAGLESLSLIGLFFSLQHRHCSQCLQRKIKVGDEEVIEYYHHEAAI